MDSTRRLLLLAGGSAGVAFALVKLGVFPGSRSQATSSGEGAAPQPFEVSHSDEEWHTLLDPDRYRILRQAGTERPFTSPLNDEHRAGVFVCAGCELDLYRSQTKFDSGTGWPSFWQPIEHAVMERRDVSLGMARTEILCRRCGGHLGHVFNDGPQPTGLRYCMNGLALAFKPAAA